MALDVKYGEIRTQVIDKLMSYKEDMVDILGKLDGAVESLPAHMEGEALNAYIDEYQQIVKRIYDKLNKNLEDYAEQLESVCKEFESLDSDMQSQLS